VVLGVLLVYKDEEADVLLRAENRSWIAAIRYASLEVRRFLSLLDHTTSNERSLGNNFSSPARASRLRRSST
jgi:hypothetical protein